MANIKCYFSRLLLLVIAIICSQVNATADYRLDKSVVPIAYDIQITPYLLQEDADKRFTFDGEAVITLKTTLDNVTSITLHKSDINITEAKLYVGETDQLIQNFQNETLDYDDITEKLTFELAESLQKGVPYQLKIVYVGHVRDGMTGFFRVGYKTPSGELDWMAVTQAQRINARTIFPCFDEPEFKASFRLVMSRPPQYKSFFNTRLLYTTPDSVHPGRFLDTFDWSPPMSSYLIGFVLCDYVKRGDDDLVLIAPSNEINFTDFSYQVAQRTLDAYSRLTASPYKALGNAIMQKITSPLFPHNGMENWGLVIYRDHALIQRPYYNDGWLERTYTIKTLVHETAHMWFGNSVTFAWWSYFWLNEAFARYYQYFLAHELYPEYELDEQFVVEQIHLIFAVDASNDTQPLTTEESLVRTPNQIASKFSSITYAKGAAVLRMFTNLMGREHFNAAIREYLKEFHLKNVVPADLFKHLKNHWPNDHSVDLDEFFHDWTEQVGFPVLYVNLTSNGQRVTIRQQRFLLEPNDGSDATLNYTVPITYATNLNPNFTNLAPVAYYNGNKGDYKLLLDDSIEWIILNNQQSNYYRVFYDNETLTHIRTALMQSNHSGIPSTNRAQLIDDLFNYARTGMINYVTVFQFLECLATETSHIVWTTALKGLRRVDDRLPEADKSNYQAFLFNITAKIYNETGLEARANDTIQDIYNRNELLDILSKHNHKECNFKAQEIFQSKVGNISVDIRQILHCSAMRNGTYADYSKLLTMYESESNENEKHFLLTEMGCTKHFARDHYEYCLSDKVPDNLKRIGLKRICTENYENVTPGFKILTSNVTLLSERVGGWDIAALIIIDCTYAFTTSEQLEMFEDFIETDGHNFGSSYGILKAAVETIENNLLWADKNLGDLKVFLRENYGGASSIFKPQSILIILLVASVVYLINK